MKLDTLVNHARRLSDLDKQRLHREVARMVAPLYREMYGDKWRAGMENAQGRHRSIHGAAAE